MGAVENGQRRVQALAMGWQGRRDTSAGKQRLGWCGAMWVMQHDSHAPEADLREARLASGGPELLFTLPSYRRFED